MEAIRDAIWAIENLPDHRARYVKEQFDRKFPHNEVSLSHFSSRGHFLPKKCTLSGFIFGDISPGLEIGHFEKNSR